MRSLLVVLALAGCGGATSSGPAWPAPSTTADDGGESIEPRSTSIATAIEKAADKDETPAPAEAEPADKPAAASEPDKPADKKEPAAPPVVDDVIISDEIIIEIED